MNPGVDVVIVSSLVLQAETVLCLKELIRMSVIGISPRRAAPSPELAQEVETLLNQREAEGDFRETEKCAALLLLAGAVLLSPPPPRRRR